MTTEEKRSRMTAMCRIGNKSPYNDCGMCRISDSCRKTGHPPEYMSNDTVETIYNNAIQIKVPTADMTTREMRNELTRVCDLVTVEDCRNSTCPISKSCDKYSERIPENMTAEQVRAVYADLVRLEKFKEEQNAQGETGFP